MYAKKTLAAVTLGLVFVSGAALAEQIPHTVMVEAVVPTSSFNVEPQGSWIANPLVLQWDAANETLRPNGGNNFSMKSTLGAISAHLDYPATLASGSNSVDLTVEVAGKVLAVGTATELYTAPQASAGQTAELRISAVKPSGAGFVPGSYAGNVALMFESVAPPP